MQNTISNKIILEDRKNLSITGVESVDAFLDQSIKLTIGGSKLTIVGEQLKVISFNKATGNLLVEGHINEIKYNSKKQPIMKRIFK